MDFCLLSTDETDAGEYEEEYLKLLELSDTRYLYEFMRLGVDLTPFNTLGHIAAFIMWPCMPPDSFHL